MQKSLLLICKCLTCIIALFSSYISTNAATPTVNIAPTPSWVTAVKPYDKKPPLRSVQKGYFYNLVEEQINIDQQADYNHCIREIVSQTGVQNGSEISVSFDPSYQKLYFHQITVWRNNVAENRLKPSGFKILADEEEYSKFIYNGQYSASYILADVRKGDRIEFSYTIIGDNPIFNNKFSQTIYIQGSKPIAHQYTSLLLSANRNLNIKPFNNVPKVAVTRVNNNQKRYVWESFQLRGVNGNDNDPAWFDAYDRVQVSEYNNWGEVVNWALSINPVPTILSDKLAAQVAALKAASGGDKLKYLRSAVKFVQDEIRYMGIETGQYSHKANNPEKVFNQRYGDCKDKSLLLASILKANGIEAHMVLINTGMDDKIDQLLPSPVVFDHAVVTAIVNNKQVWIDATMSYQRGTGFDLYFPAYGKGLVLKPGNQGLTPIPVPKTGKVDLHESYTIPGETADVTLNVKTTYTRNQADRMRARLASNGIEETEKQYLDYYAKTYPKIEQKDSMVVKDNEEKNELTVSEAYTISDFLKKDSIPGKFTASFYADYIDNQLPTIASNTKTPVSVNYPYAIDYWLSVKLLYGWDVDDTHSTLVRDAYLFKTDKTVSGSTLIFHYNFAYLKKYVPAQKLPEFENDIKSIQRELSDSIEYTPDMDRLPFQLNKWMAIMVLCLVLVSAFAGYSIYCTETLEPHLPRNAYTQPIAGPLVYIMASLAIAPIQAVATMISQKYLSQHTWNTYEAGLMSLHYRILLVFQTFGNVTVACFSVFCLILMYNKRDILPRIAIGFYTFAMLFYFVEFFYSRYVTQTSTDSDISTVIIAIVVGAVCTRFFKTSYLVDDTFTVPYPAKRNDRRKP